MSKKIGLVLGGLGGFNSISAAFLQAVVDRNVKFDAISCTSGAILTVSQMFFMYRPMVKMMTHSKIKKVVLLELHLKL